MTFRNTIVFPEEVSYASDSILRMDTEVLGSDSGHENRESAYPFPLNEYNVTYAIKTLDELYAVYEIFIACRGRHDSFRYRDWLDYTSAEPEDEGARLAPEPTATDQVIGIGDDYETDFQLVKRYTAGGVTRLRNITAPEAGTVLIAFDGVAQASGWTVDTATGIVTFDTPPADGVQITAGFEFDVPVRFDADSLPLNLEAYGVGSARDVRLVETRT